MKIAFVGPTYPLVSKPASVQRTVGMYPVPLEPGNERTSWVFKDVPGLVEVEAVWGVEAADWLGYNFDDLGPAMRSFETFAALGSPVPWSDGTLFSNLTSTNSDIVWVPLSGGTAEAPTIVENVNWFPSTPGGTAPTFFGPDEDPSSGVWTGMDWLLQGTASGYLVLEGISGPTTITFVITPGGGASYDGAALLYGVEL